MQARCQKISVETMVIISGFSFLASQLFPASRLDFLQLGPGSANIGAALLACLLVSGAWLFFTRSRWTHVMGWVWMLGFGGLLLATRSRGGIVASLAGLICVGLCHWHQRNRQKPAPLDASEADSQRTKITRRHLQRWGIAAVLIAVLVGYGLANGSLQRFTLGDSSRADLWPAGLAMLWDAPGGWGIGGAADAYVQWYQSPDDPRGYLSLINAHLNWLVEHGMMARIGYTLVWAAVFWVTLSKPRCPKISAASLGVLATATGVWGTFFLAAIFSNIVKWTPIWSVPLIWLLIVIIWRWRAAIWLSWRIGAALAGTALAGLLLLHIAGWALQRHPLREAGSRRVIVGEGPTRVVFYQPSPEILGNRWGQDVRRLVEEANVTADVIHTPLRNRDEPTADAVWILSGSLPEIFPKSRAVVFMNTICTSELQRWLELHMPNRVFVYVSDSLTEAARIGEWDALASRREGMKIEIIGGAASFIPNWPTLVAGIIGNVSVTPDSVEVE